MIYASLAGGTRELWMRKAGDPARQITNNADLGFFATPSVCPDGRTIVYGAGRLGSALIWKLDADGGKPETLVPTGTNGGPSCSPDGKWKASVGSVSLDAGADNEFRNARLSCIAGPCPFTQVESDGFSKWGRVITASLRNWSDTVTFALEAEVFRTENTNKIQRSYPIILGRGLNFTLAATAAGVSIEAEVDGSPIVFPLAPNGFLSWATCEIRVQRNFTHLYRCELKPGYVFKAHEGE